MERIKMSVNDYVKILEEEYGASKPNTKSIKKDEFDFKKELQKCVNRKEVEQYEFTFSKTLSRFLKMIKNDFEKNKPYNFKKTKIKKYCLVRYKNHEVTLSLWDRLKNLLVDIWEHTKFCWSYDNFFRIFFKKIKKNQ